MNVNVTIPEDVVRGAFYCLALALGAVVGKWLRPRKQDDELIARLNVLDLPDPACSDMRDLLVKILRRRD